MANDAEKLVKERTRMADGAIDPKGARAAMAKRGDKRTKAKWRAKEESFDSSDGSESSLFEEEEDEPPRTCLLVKCNGPLYY
mmetsp:Transcript_5927/g.13043  ORF Transcript_5927/g.13043 Transcript_5927/m.13043 type:complete len:82 (+) Transcript_5927:623-868(+)